MQEPPAATAKQLSIGSTPFVNVVVVVSGSLLMTSLCDVGVVDVGEKSRNGELSFFIDGKILTRFNGSGEGDGGVEDDPSDFKIVSFMTSKAVFCRGMMVLDDG